VSLPIAIPIVSTHAGPELGVDVGAERSLQQALATVTQLQHAITEHMTVMIPGEWQPRTPPQCPVVSPLKAGD
jgi:hypothetical protein